METTIAIPDKQIISPSPAVFEGKNCFSKIEVCVMKQGTAAGVNWVLRDENGQPVDLSYLLTSENELKSDHSIKVRIQTADEMPNYMWEICGEVYNAKEGIIRFNVPLQVSDMGGIFVVEGSVVRKFDNRPILIHRGLLSVERSMWGQHMCKCPTLQEIRARISDTPEENLLNGYVEFTNSDILDSVIAAVLDWNKTSPNMEMYTYNCSNFPFKEPWIDFIAASLYNKAALRFMRVSLNVNHGGIQGDDLHRQQEYKAVASELFAKWTNFVKTEKIIINMGQAFAVIHSPYGTIQNDNYQY